MIKAGAAQAGQITGALARREQAIRLARQALSQAEEAFQAAQTRQAEAMQALAEAQAGSARSEEQWQRVVALRASGAVVRAAQQDREDGEKARSRAQADGRAASEALGLASRALAQARAGLQAIVPSDAPAPPSTSERQPPPREIAPEATSARPARRTAQVAAVVASLLAVGAGALWFWLAHPANPVGLTIERSGRTLH